MTFSSLARQIGFHDAVCCLHRNLNDCKAEFDTEIVDKVYTGMVWAFICEWMHNLLNWYSLWNSYE